MPFGGGTAPRQASGSPGNGGRDVRRRSPGPALRGQWPSHGSNLSRSTCQFKAGPDPGGTVAPLLGFLPYGDDAGHLADDVDQFRARGNDDLGIVASGTSPGPRSFRSSWAFPTKYVLAASLTSLIAWASPSAARILACLMPFGLLDLRTASPRRPGRLDRVGKIHGGHLLVLRLDHLVHGLLDILGRVDLLQLRPDDLHAPAGWFPCSASSAARC